MVLKEQLQVHRRSKLSHIFVVGAAVQTCLFFLFCAILLYWKAQHYRNGLPDAMLHRLRGSGGRYNAAVQLEQSKECRCVDCDEDKLCGGLWRGVRHRSNDSGQANPTELLVHVVVSHCSGTLDWLEDYIRPEAAAYEIASVRVISRCGRAPTLNGVSPKGAATVEVLLSAGQDGHSHAHSITSVVLDGLPVETGAASPVVVFLNDDRVRIDLHRRRSFQEMVSLAAANGFACGSASTRWSAYHDRDSLFKFHARWAAYDNLGAYYDHITSIDPEEAGDPVHALADTIPVCYGGVFAATAARLQDPPPRVWRRLEETLARGDGIAEEHFAERLWALLLAEPLERHEEKAVRRWANGHVGPLPALGALVHYEKERDDAGAGGR